MWNCEERASEATARVVLRGRGGSRSRRHNDAVTLHRGDDGWQVALPPNFGIVKRK
jgi:hypothetical protein